MRPYRNIPLPSGFRYLEIDTGKRIFLSAEKTRHVKRAIRSEVRNGVIARSLTPGSLHQPFPRAEPRKSLTEPSSYFGDSGIPPYPGGLLLAAAPSMLCLYGEPPSAGQLLVAASAAYTASGCWVPGQDPCASLLGLSQLPSATP